MLKKRSVGLVILFSIITCGIYSLYWYWVTIDALHKEGQSSNMEPIVQFILMFVYVGSFLLGYNANANVNAIRQKKGLAPVDNQVAWIVLGLIPIVQIALIQSAINEIADN